jgi:rhodanese-related sulfurtransferase
MATSPQVLNVIAASSVGFVDLRPPSDEVSAAVLARSRALGSSAGLAYSGDLTPNEAFDLLAAGAARLIDVRTPEERKFVGYIAGSIAVPWATGTTFQRNPRFLRELEGKARKDEVLLFVCRSGSRSAAAAEAASRAQFQHAFNILEGFEGELDAHGQRNSSGGWKLRALPWLQD